MPGVLAGLNIVEMAAIGPVPFAGMMMADMGARLIRIDRIPRVPGTGPTGFEHRGRESVAVNLKTPAGIAIVLRLIADTDVLIEGFRPGVMEKLGLGPDICLVRNPRLIYARMTGWGQSGPLARTAGHDLNYIALTGALHAIGGAEQPAVPLNLVGDYGGGAMFLLCGVLAALFERSQSGQGQVIDAAMTEGAAALMTPIYSMKAHEGWRDARASNMLDGGAHFYGIYACADGEFISIGAIEPQFYALLIEHFGLDAHEFYDQMNKADWPRLRERLAKIIVKRSRTEWTALLEGTDLCFAPVLSMTEAPLHAHNQARGSFVDFGGHVMPAPAPRFGRTASTVAPPAGRDGTDSRAVLQEVGFSDAEIDALLGDGVVYAAPEPVP